MGDFQYDVIAAAIDYLASHGHEASPNLDDLAATFGYEPTHFQKLFKDKAGISPKRVMQYMRYSRAREFLLDGYPTLDAAYAAGLSGNGRLHDLFVSVEAATPGMVQRRGEGMVIRYGYHATPLGEILVGCTEIGMCWLGFVVDGSRDAPYGQMVRHWPKATLVADEAGTRAAADHVLRIWSGRGDASQRLRLDLHGTNFQVQVWRALLKIPSGATMSYQDIADALGAPQSSRAVGTAVGYNPISLLIPCHRVIQKSGIVENYMWGTARKKIILGMEAERNHSPSTSRME